MKNLMGVLSLLFGLAISGNVGADNTIVVLDPAEATVNKSFEVAANWSELKRGWNVLVLKVTDASQQVVTGAEVTVQYDMVAMPMDPPEQPVVEKGEGIYEKRVFLGMKGEWHFEVKVKSVLVEDNLAKNQNILK